MSTSSDSPNSEWYYQLLGLATGPVTLERLKWLFDNDHLTAESLVGRSENGPWQRIDESPLAKLVGQKAKANSPEKKKAVRISSGRKASSKKLPAVRDKSTPRKKPSVPLTEDGHVTGGIEIDETVEELHLPEKQAPVVPTAQAPRLTKQPSSRPASKPQVYDDLEVVSPGREARKSQAERKKDQQLWYLKAGGALLGVVLLVGLCVMFFGERTDPVAKAYDCFTETAAGIERNSVRMDDVQWNQWVKDKRVEVEKALEPLRAEANSSEPGVQSLVWAGEQLLNMLAGARVLPEEMTAKFENYMADFAEAPMSDVPLPSPSNPKDDVPAEAKRESANDPAFAQ